MVVTVVQPKGVAGVENLGFVIKREHSIGPMQVRRDYKFQFMSIAQIQAIAIFHNPSGKRLMHHVLQKLDCHF